MANAPTHPDLALARRIASRYARHTTERAEDLASIACVGLAEATAMGRVDRRSRVRAARNSIRDALRWRDKRRPTEVPTDIDALVEKQLGPVEYRDPERIALAREALRAVINAGPRRLTPAQLECLGRMLDDEPTAGAADRMMRTKVRRALAA